MIKTDPKWKKVSRMKSKSWDDKFYVKVYQLARAGANDTQIAGALGVSVFVLKKWVKARPALKHAMRVGRCKDSKLSDWIYRRLDGKYKKVWDEICRVEKLPNGLQKVEALFDEHGEGCRKYLFLYALVNSHYNPSEACRRINVSYRTFKGWIRDDFEFANAISEIEEHKDNFFESVLVELTDQRNPKAALFAARTRLRHRGYNDKVLVEHSGTVKVEQTIELGDKLLGMLSKNTKREILQAVEQLQLEDQTKELNSNTIIENGKVVQ
jgi:hypothetical protein